MASEALTTVQHSPDSDVKQAVRAVFSAMRADFGGLFTAAANDTDANAWKWRLLKRVDGIPADCVIDGYERAVKERKDRMPTLVDISEAARAIHRDRIQAEERQWPRAPQVNGLAGYVEHLANANRGNPVAEQVIAMMREIFARPDATTADERNARLDKALAAHREILAGHGN